jgi:ABC-type Fe3+-siderophore transport system permease subunit
MHGGLFTFWYKQMVARNPKTQRNAILNAILVYLGLAVATVLLGLVLRLVPLGLPFLVVKYGGSALWAVMVYLLLAAFLPDREPLFIALAAAIFAALVELLRLYHSPGLDAFRLTLAGALLLGRVFSLWHFVAYWAAIAGVAIVDRTAIRPRLARGG